MVAAAWRARLMRAITAYVGQPAGLRAVQSRYEILHSDNISRLLPSPRMRAWVRLEMNPGKCDARRQARPAPARESRARIPARRESLREG
jgi:hypothetical protein